MVDVPVRGIPLSLVSERIVEQMVDVSVRGIPQAPVSLYGHPSVEGFFSALFPPRGESARSAGSSSARVHGSSSSWTLAAYEAEEAAYPDLEYEFFGHEDFQWVRRWIPSWSGYAWWLIDPDDGQWQGLVTKAPWDSRRGGLGEGAGVGDMAEHGVIMHHSIEAF